MDPLVPLVLVVHPACRDRPGALGVQTFAHGRFDSSWENPDHLSECMSEWSAMGGPLLTNDLRGLSRSAELPDGPVHEYDVRGSPESAAAEALWLGATLACQKTGVDLSSCELGDAVPPWVLRELPAGLAKAIYVRHGRAYADDPGGLELYAREEYPVRRVLLDVEQRGIGADVGLCRRRLAEGRDPVEERFYRSVLEEEEGGLVHTYLGLRGTKTYRFRVEGGLNVHGIPRGPAREAIVSRHLEGSIASIDFNAIDYRSLVAAATVSGAGFAARYAGVDDFHAATAEMLFGDAGMRDAAKGLTYVVVYGGGPETVAKLAETSLEEARRLIARTEELLAPIVRFRDELHRRAVAQGFVQIHGSSRRVPVAPGDHPGKVVGIYAQAHSSLVFERALVSAWHALRFVGSKIVFTVHDEAVVDVVPGEEAAVLVAAKNMEAAAGPGFKTSVRSGRNYREATE